MEMSKTVECPAYDNIQHTTQRDRSLSMSATFNSRKFWWVVGILAAAVALLGVLSFIVAVIALALARDIRVSSISAVTNNFQPQNCPGSSANKAASSCQQILNCNHFASSGDYWIKSEDGSSVQRYCDMNRVCGGVRGGWRRVARLDMRNSESLCPNGLREIAHPGKRLCARNLHNTVGCSQVFFGADNLKYDKVCGKIIAYQLGSTDSFGLNGNPVSSIDEVYLDGVSLTYGSSPRKHIWSFAAALDEVGAAKSQNCPCTNIDFAASATSPPSFVGNDYFCDTASDGRYVNGHFYANDPLWDGAGCGTRNTCCFLNDPPWFFKQLGSSTNANIEMRVCSNEFDDNEDVLIEQIEIYVR